MQNPIAEISPNFKLMDYEVFSYREKKSRSLMTDGQMDRHTV